MLDKVKNSVKEIGLFVRNYDKKLKLLKENQELADAEWKGLQEKWELTEKHVFTERTLLKTTIADTLSTLNHSHSKLSLSLNRQKQAQLTHQRQQVRVTQLQLTLKAQRSQRIRLLMSFALHEIIKKRLNRFWELVYSVCGTKDLEVIMEKVNGNQFRYESLKMDASALVEHNAGLRTVFMNLKAEKMTILAENQRNFEELMMKRKYKFDDFHVNQREKLGKVVIMELKKTLAKALERDVEHTWLPAGISVPDLSLPQLLLVYKKAIGLAMEISLQQPTSRRRSTIFAAHIVLHSTKRASYSKASPLQRTHFYPVKTEKRPINFEDLSLEGTASRYEKAAWISSVKSSPMHSFRLEELSPDEEKEELNQVRSLQKEYKREKNEAVSGKIGLNRTGTTLTGRKMNKVQKRAKVAREMVKLDQERHRLMLVCRQMQQEGSQSCRALGEGVSVWALARKQLPRVRTAISTPGSPKSCLPLFPRPPVSPKAFHPL